jgi:hypothetical protein
LNENGRHQNANNHSSRSTEFSNDECQSVAEEHSNLANFAAKANLDSYVVNARRRESVCAKLTTDCVALSAEQTVEACLDVLTLNKLECAPVLRSGSKTDCMGFLDMTDLVGFVVDIASTGDIENDRVS